jgi:hypothetical protein
MNVIFEQHVDAFHARYEALVGMEPVTLAHLSKTIPTSGIYLFSEGIIIFMLAAPNDFEIGSDTIAFRRRCPLCFQACARSDGQRGNILEERFAQGTLD